jgi:O-antigen/teichoic acid export membrane protein
MKKPAANLIAKISRDKFFQASFWVFLGTGFLSFGNYLYHFLMGRMLEVSLYGALQSIISVLYILSVPTLTMTLVIVKYVSAHKGRGEYDMIQNLYSFAISKLLLYGSIVLGILVAASPLIQSFLHLPSLFLALLLPVSFFINLFYLLNKSMLQGLSSFFKFSVLNFLEASAKIFFAVLLVYLGFKVEGAYGAIVLSIIAALIISTVYLRGVVKAGVNLRAKYVQAGELLKFALPTFVTSLSLISLFTTDVILARHFFPGVESGYYSALSVLGKIVYFAASPIVLVLFPMISENHARGESYHRLLKLGALFTFLVTGFVTAVYFLIPEFMVLTLFGEKYLEISGLLGMFGVFIALLSLAGLFANFYLSINKTFPSYIILSAAVLQIILLFIYNETLAEIIWVSITVTFLLLISLLLYYPRAKFANKKNIHNSSGV